jgi:hypothetical protein
MLEMVKLKTLMDFAPVAQLDRVADFESEGCRFESCRARYDCCSYLLQYRIYGACDFKMNLIIMFGAVYSC